MQLKEHVYCFARIENVSGQRASINLMPFDDKGIGYSKYHSNIVRVAVTVFV